jgi:hypothetical protein
VPLSSAGNGIGVGGTLFYLFWLSTVGINHHGVTVVLLRCYANNFFYDNNLIQTLYREA